MPSILIIDDDELVREATQILLRANGYEVGLAADGKSGIEAARSRPFDLAIVDLFMPGMNGLQVTKALRQENPGMAMIIASGFMLGGDRPEMPEFGQMAVEAGAVFALYKPFRPAEILSAVTKALASASAAA
jgi:CheY-like chemotaxis protein